MEPESLWFSASFEEAEVRSLLSYPPAELCHGSVLAPGLLGGFREGWLGAAGRGSTESGSRRGDVPSPRVQRPTGVPVPAHWESINSTVCSCLRRSFLRGIGKNVLCEKAATSVDAFRMVTAARYYPKLMSIVGNVLRFLPAFVKMKQLIEERYVGNVIICDVRVYGGSLLSHQYNWICDELMGGGGLHTMGTYIIDLLTHLTSRRAEKVHGLLKTFVKQNTAISGIRHVTSDDFCVFQMLMSDGVCCTVTLNFNMPGSFIHEVMIVGSAGRLIARGTDLYGQKNTALREELLFTDSLPVNKGLLDKGFKDIPLLYLKGMVYMVQALRQSFQDQEDRRTWDHKPVSMAASFEDGLYMQSVVEAIKKSSRSGEWETVEVMTEEPDANQNLCEALQRNNL
ncbi:glucose-fructose oxidoreductase domain-containing protein 2 isoform X2 [Onychostruthus taczanowskii]|uniref:glucose-fructose oxidoreductase domain-containing protein 2 isoform X2 n=1 Tax=Onychostruthus taczanowskii TaxID=356909 RepID=UPI001B80DE12|nr:glucose-fructose oxidoreductase domain-containing protein 2 isoform X2 [Onychostruthus taczanowskii]